MEKIDVNVLLQNLKDSYTVLQQQKYIIENLKKTIGTVNDLVDNASEVDINISSIRLEIRNIDTQITSIMADIASITRRLSSVEETSTYDHNEILQITTHTIPTLATRITQCETDITNLSSTVTTLRTDLNSLSTSVTSQLSSLSSDITALWSETGSINTALSQLRQDMNDGLADKQDTINVINFPTGNTGTITQEQFASITKDTLAKKGSSRYYHIVTLNSNAKTFMSFNMDDLKAYEIYIEEDDGSYIWYYTVRDLQELLTTGRITTGTLDTVLGFDNNDNLIRGTVSGGDSWVNLYTYSNYGSQQPAQTLTITNLSNYKTLRITYALKEYMNADTGCKYVQYVDISANNALGDVCLSGMYKSNESGITGLSYYFRFIYIKPSTDQIALDTTYKGITGGSSDRPLIVYSIEGVLK